jgi:hypothetical protein
MKVSVNGLELKPKFIVRGNSEVRRWMSENNQSGFMSELKYMTSDGNNYHLGIFSEEDYVAYLLKWA